MMNEDMKLIENVIDEAVTMKKWGRKNDVMHYEVLTIDGEPMTDDGFFLVGLNKRYTTKAVANYSTPINSNRFGDSFYGELSVFYCKKKKNFFGKEVVKTVRFYSKRYFLDDSKNIKEEKTKLKDLI